jgi:hypothetical protein
MKFNLAVPREAKQASDYLGRLQEKQNIVEVKRVSPGRTLSQNSYLHLLIGAFGNHFGYTLEEAKLIYKELNHEIYRYRKKERIFWRSSADLNKEEMAKTIDVFMRKSAEAGYPMPLATDQGWLREIENEIERSKYYL